MADLNKGAEAIAQALLDREFRAVGEYDSMVTFERADDRLKVHAAPDGSFAAFNGDDELVAEGEGPEDLFRILVTKTPIATPQSRVRGESTIK